MRIKEALLQGRKVEAIRVYRECTGAGLIEAKAAVERLEAELHCRTAQVRRRLADVPAPARRSGMPTQSAWDNTRHRREDMTPRQALAFVRKHGVVLEAAQGPVPSLAEAIAGGPIRGSWWAHPSGHLIFEVTRAVRDAEQVLVCRVVHGKVTFIHERIWPALVRLGDSSRGLDSPESARCTPARAATCCVHSHSRSGFRPGFASRLLGSARPSASSPRHMGGLGSLAVQQAAAADGSREPCRRLHVGMRGFRLVEQPPITRKRGMPTLGGRHDTRHRRMPVTSSGCSIPGRTRIGGPRHFRSSDVTPLQLAPRIG